MKATLIDYTGCGHQDPWRAVSLLIFTKSTRLNMTPGLMSEIEAWPAKKKLEELEYMANTIPSSWEFVQYNFLIEGVTRAFTHQFVRTRTASFAQQTMRVLDVGGWEYGTGPTIPDVKETKETCSISGFHYHDCMGQIAAAYDNLIKDGAAIEDARGILPTNILTNIACSMNMRTFVEMVRKRSSPRTQGEYRDVLEAMKEAVRAVHPWIDLFIDRTFDRAANELCDELLKLSKPADEVGRKDDEQLSKETATKLIKLVDQMRAQS